MVLRVGRRKCFRWLLLSVLVFAPVGFVSADPCPPNLDFETDAAGHTLELGQIIDDEWAALGIEVTTHQPGEHPAMIFDSAHPTGGDRDLGSPNKTFAGSGKGSGGAAGKDGANAFGLGNVLILSEDGDADDPDDNAQGGTIIFAFAEAMAIDSVAILDIDHGEAAGTIRTFDAADALLTEVAMSPLGNNSFQTVPVATTGVHRLEVHFPRSGAIAEVNFCAAPDVESICLPTIDFETDAAGQPLTLGQRIDDEWAAFGMHVTTHKPWRFPAMIFDSSAPTGGDHDLGAPNVDFGGPGVGSGGGSGQAGENSAPLGNVLIVSEDNDASDPDDRGQGGTLAFTFDQPVFLSSLDLLDIDSNEASTITAFDGANHLIGEQQLLPLGDNSLQSLAMPLSGVRRLEVRLAKSGAVSAITFCEPDEPPPSPVCPCSEAIAEFAAFVGGQATISSCFGTLSPPNLSLDIIGELPGYVEAVASTAQTINDFFCGFFGVTEDSDDVFEFLQITQEEAEVCIAALTASAASQDVTCD